MIFGTSAPQFIIAGPDTLNLNYVTIEKDEPQIDFIQQESVVNGHRNFVIKGKHWEFHVLQHLWKFASPITQYQDAKNNFEGHTGSLYRHKDAPPFTEQFILYSVEEYYLERSMYKDLILYKFRSIDYVDITDTLDVS
jgi:hypothetical protein